MTHTSVNSSLFFIKNWKIDKDRVLTTFTKKEEGVTKKSLGWGSKLPQNSVHVVCTHPHAIYAATTSSSPCDVQFFSFLHGSWIGVFCKNAYFYMYIFVRFIFRKEDTLLFREFPIIFDDFFHICIWHRNFLMDLKMVWPCHWEKWASLA